jgi:protein-histidine pros-kinase
MKLSLAAKFNLVFISIFLVGFAAAGYVADYLLKQSAREETVQTARLLMESALATRTYTSKHVLPLLQTQLKYEFIPESVPSFSAVEAMTTLLKKYPAFSYREAVLNPTNPRNRTQDWEADVVNKLRSQSAPTEFIGERDSQLGRVLYIARPFQIKDPACLTCHSVPAAAPKTMLDLYGSNNGFGWKFMEVVGAQIISVPMDVPLQRAQTIFRTFMLSLLGVFAFLFVALNVMVYFSVTRRISRLSKLADQVSMGNFAVEEFDAKGGDEVSTLTQSFGRMRTSLASALKMLEEG